MSAEAPVIHKDRQEKDGFVMRMLKIITVVTGAITGILTLIFLLTSQECKAKFAEVQAWWAKDDTVKPANQDPPSEATGTALAKLGTATKAKAAAKPAELVAGTALAQLGAATKADAGAPQVAPPAKVAVAPPPRPGTKPVGNGNNVTPQTDGEKTAETVEVDKKRLRDFIKLKP